MLTWKRGQMERKGGRSVGWSRRVGKKDRGLGKMEVRMREETNRSRGQNISKRKSRRASLWRDCIAHLMHSRSIVSHVILSYEAHVHTLPSEVTQMKASPSSMRR